MATYRFALALEWQGFLWVSCRDDMTSTKIQDRYESVRTQYLFPVWFASHAQPVRREYYVACAELNAIEIPYHEDRAQL